MTSGRLALTGFVETSTGGYSGKALRYFPSGRNWTLEQGVEEAQSQVRVDSLIKTLLAPAIG
ncbi:unnamed protein product [Dibothriocephalus latus]|uniref:Uncharacterized protein n=1 Tax=Dibothriocephalus latus TaxID=60516 RepID=A0A3P6QJG3_DIBLA|nr:unnamed protein product [Dibothriocephalus latus]